VNAQRSSAISLLRLTQLCAIYRDKHRTQKNLLHFDTNTWNYQEITANTSHQICFWNENDLNQTHLLK